MASPVSLGLVAAGNVQDAYGGSGITGPLTLTTTVDIPPTTLFNPVTVPIVFVCAPFGNFDENLEFDIFTISDDAPGSGPTNDYIGPLASGGSGAYAYDLGNPRFVVPGSFGIAESETAFNGGSFFFVYNCIPVRAMPSGTTITVDFSINPDIPGTWLSATVLGYVKAALPVIFFGGRCLEPLDTNTGDDSFVPVGDHVFDEVVNSTNQLFALAWSDDAAGDPIGSGTPVDGTTQTMTDLSGRWTTIDSDGSASTSNTGGLAFTVFALDAATTDLTQPMMTFENDVLGNNTGGFPGGTPPDLLAGFAMFELIPGFDAAPVFNHRFRVQD